MINMRKLANEEMERKTIDSFKAAQKIPVIAILENIRSAYNVGSVFRTADGFLLEGVYCIGYTAYPPNPKLEKTALGSTETVPWKHFKTSAEAITELKANGYTLLAAEQVEPAHYLQHYTFSPKTAIVFGNEITGVEQSTIDACDGTIEIPQLGMKHSINIANAASIILWEAAKPFI
jgi:23S rRNA (guanosine2251-2'-O)-methyltransferase